MSSPEPDSSQLQNALEGGRTFRDLNSLEKQWIIGQATAQIDFRTTAGQPQEDGGTGLLFPGGWLLTCCHVLPTEERAKDARAYFGFRRDREGHRLGGTPISLAPNDNGFFTGGGQGIHDWTLVRLDPTADLSPFGHVVLDPAAELKRGDQAAIIQHPGAKPAKIAEGTLTFSTPQDLRYHIETEKGSSGAPVINARGDVIGIHNRAVDSANNGGVPITSVIQQLQAQANSPWPEIEKQGRQKRLEVGLVDPKQNPQYADWLKATQSHHRYMSTWLAVVVALLLLLAAGVTWSVFQQEDTSSDIATLKYENQTLLAALRDLPAALLAAQQKSPQTDKATQLASAYASLGEAFHLPPGTLEKELPAFARKLLAASDTSLLDRANAEFVLKNFPEAEKIALRAKDAALATAAKPVQDAIAALKLAGQSASEQIQYKRALDHYRTAAVLTSEEKGVLAWAELQNEIGWLLYLDGQYEENATLMHRVWQECKKAGYPEHPTTLLSHHLWAVALWSQDKHAEAEAECRALIPIRAHVLGPEHEDTLISRNALAVFLYNQHKNVEAEAEIREVIAIRERILRREHPDTLRSRNNLANILSAQGKYTEAEAEHRDVLDIQERVLTLEHPDVSLSCFNLSITLENLDRKAEALVYARRALAGRNKMLGEAHPLSLAAKRQVEDMERE